MNTFKKPQFLIFVLLFIFACHTDHDNLLPNDCLTTSDNPDWHRERFNTTFTIMFPNNYVGGIRQEAAGTTFQKISSDNNLIFSGGFCNPLAYPCMASDYQGQALDGNIESISYTDLRGQLAYLNKRVIYCTNQNVIAYFYFTNSYGGTLRDSYGQLYLKTCDNSCYKMAGIIEFSSKDQQVVINIIKTIRQE